MGLKDYYQALNVSRDASALEIKRAFRQLALQYHPDRNPENAREAGEKFKEINEAYEVLSDERKKYRYDMSARLAGNPLRTVYVEDIDGIGVESILELFRRAAGMGFIARGMGWGKPWGCERRQGGQCRRQWRQDID